MISFVSVSVRRFAVEAFVQCVLITQWQRMLTDRFVFYTGGSDTEERPGYTGQTCEKNDSTVYIQNL